MRLALLICAVLHAVAFVWYSNLPIDRDSKPTGNFFADNICIPVGAVTLVGLVLLGIANAI